MLKERFVDEVEEIKTSRRRRKSLQDKRPKASRQQREEAVQHHLDQNLAVHEIGLGGCFYASYGLKHWGGGGGRVAVLSCFGLESLVQTG